MKVLIWSELGFFEVSGTVGVFAVVELMIENQECAVSCREFRLLI